MMTLNKLVIDNICQHTGVREIDLRPGLVAVVGTNGRGKSNLAVACPAMALCRKTPEGKPRQDMVGGWGLEKKTGSLTLEFEADGHEYTLTVKVPTGVVLERDNQVVTTKEAEVQKIMTDITGVTPDQLLETVFQDQTGVLEFVEMLPTERGKLMMKWFRMRDLSKAADAVQKVIQGLPAVPDRSLEVESILSTETRAKEELVRADARLAELRVREASERQALGQALAILSRPVDTEISAERTRFSSELAAAREARKALDSQKPESVAQPLARKAPYDKGEMHTGTLRDIQTRKDARVRAESVLVDAQAKLDALAGRKPADFPAEDVESLRVDGEWLTASRPYRQACIDRVCPTCQRDYEVQEPEKFLAEFKTVEDRFSQTRSRKSAWDTAMSAWTHGHTGAVAAVAQAKAGVESAGKRVAELVAPAGFDPQEYVRILAQEKAWSGYSQALGAWGTRAASADSRVARAETSLAGLAGDTVTSVQKESAQATADAWDTLQSDLRDTLSAKAVAESELVTCGERDHVLRQGMTRDIRITRQRELLTEFRAHLLWDGIPASVVRTNLGRFNRRLATTLNDTQRPFTARITPDFEIVFDKPDNQAWGKPACLLSGGEKMFLAISIRASLPKVIGCGVPLLEFDEPTSWVSGDNLDAMLDFFSRLRTSLGDRICILVVTHERRLLAHCDCVYDVDPENPHSV